MTAIATLTMNPAIDISTDVARVEPDHKLRCGAERQDPGGGGINCARVIARLGGDVTAVFPAGGVVGLVLQQLVAQEGVASVPVATRAETRLNFTVLERETGREFRFVLPGPELEDSERRALAAAASTAADRGGFLIVSGSMPPGLPDAFLSELAQAARRRGIRLVLDTSGAALKAGLAAGAFLVKPNLRELGELTGAPLGDEASRLAACRELVASGRAEAVALTLGRDGALLVTRELALRARPLAVRAVSTVGAGDSFLGGMVWSIARGDSLADALRYGMAAGSAALLTPGTGLCRVEDAMRLYREAEAAPV
jgi:6-phosphofructokinase 2